MVVNNKVSNSYSLSLVQRDIFFDQLHNLVSPKYNIGGYVSLAHVDVEKITLAHARLVLRNRMFRMSLINSENGVQVRYTDTVDKTLPFVDLSTEGDSREAAKIWISQSFEKPFNLFEESLFRVTLLKLSDDKFYYVAIAHHLLLDGWGIANWAKQLCSYYSDIEPEQELESDIDDYHSSDFQYLESKRYAKDRSFWRKYLEGQPVPLLSASRISNNEDLSKGSFSQRLNINISKDLFERCLASSEVLRKNEHSLFFALAAVYFSRVHSRNEIVIGVPAHNRRGAAQRRLIALFTSVSPVKILLDDSWSFVQLVEKVKLEQAKVFRHQKFPIGDMVRDIGPAARNGLFDVGVNYLKLNNKFEFGEDTAEIRYVENQYQTTPFNMTVWDNGENKPIQLQIDFSLKHFNNLEVEQIGSRFKHLISQVAENPNRLIGDLNLVAPEEASSVWPDSLKREQNLNNECIDVPFIRMFECQAIKNANRIALRYLEVEFSYQQLNYLAAELALKLAQEGVGEGSLVGLLLGRRPEMLVAILALHKLGAAYLPLDASYPQSRLEFMLEDSGCALVLCTSNFKNLCMNAAVESYLVDACAELGAAESGSKKLYAQDIPAVASAESVAYVIYTSGSTGKPKGVVLSQRSLSNFLQSMAIQPGFSADDCLLAVTPFSFDISILELLMPLMQGGSVRLFHTSLTQDVTALIRDIEDYPITMLQMTPSAWKILLAAQWRGSAKLKALTGGEALPKHLAESLVPKVGSLWNMYGPTETTIWSSCTEVCLPIEFNSIGRPIANTQMLILDDRKRVLPTGIFGSLYIGGAGLAKGYLNREALTASRFIEAHGKRWYDTGDVARLRISGEFEFQGRSDHQVKLNGYRIELGEIESLLSRHPLISNCAVIIKELENGRAVLCGYYQAEAEIASESLKMMLANELPAYMLPSFFIFLKEFPRTPAGKTDIRALPAPELKLIASPILRNDQYDQTTQRLLSLIQTHLQISQLEPTDNLFDVGASSIDVTELSGKIQRDLNLNLSVIDMFSHPSVSAMVAHLNSNGSQAHAERKNKRLDAAQRGKTRLNSRLSARKQLDEV